MRQKEVKEEVTPLKADDGTMSADDTEAAWILVDYFSKVITKEVDKEPYERI